MQSRPVIVQPSSNRIIFDWITFTSKIHDVPEIINLLGLTGCQFLPCPGVNGYRDGLFFEGIKICSNSWMAGDVSICVIMSGTGCRTFESHGNGDYDTLFSLILDNFSPESENRSMNLTRLDVAYDDFIGVLSFDDCVKDSFALNYVSRFQGGSLQRDFKKCKRTNENDNEILFDRFGIPRDSDRLCGKSLYYGSNQSDVRIRIYDKRSEQGRIDMDYWYRCELQLRRGNAVGFVQQLYPQIEPVLLYPDSDDPEKKYLIDEAATAAKVADTPKPSIGTIYFGVINNYLRFVTPNPNDSNMRRWDIAEHWRNFLESLDVISVYIKPAQPYDIFRLDNYVMHTAANAIYTLINVIGIDDFVCRLRSHYVISDVNPKYRSISSHYPDHDNGIVNYMSLHNLSI